MPLIAAILLGIKVANFDPTIPLSETVYLLNLVQPKIMFVVNHAEKMMEEAINNAGIDTKIVVIGSNVDGTNENISKYLETEDGESEFVPDEVEDLNQTVVILFSSGTTGFPKGICLTHRALLTAIGLFT